MDKVRILVAAVVLLSGCPDISEVACREVTGCPGLCCSSASHCRQQVCNGVTYTCVPGDDGYLWVRGAGAPCSQVDGPISPRDGSGTEERGCVCDPGERATCPNGCGQRTCLDSCEWGDCSNAGQPASGGEGCWDPDHCPPGTPGGQARCVQCWICNPDGTIDEETWCAGAKCQPCSLIAPGCP